MIATTTRHGSCHCGVVKFEADIDLSAGTSRYVSIAVSALDDLRADELAAAPIRYVNGRDDDWFQEPADTRTL